MSSGGARPGRARSNDLSERLPFFLLKEIYVYISGTHKERRSFCRFVDQRKCEINHKSRSLSYSFITVSVIKIVIRLLTDVICVFVFEALAPPLIMSYGKASQLVKCYFVRMYDIILNETVR